MLHASLVSSPHIKIQKEHTDSLSQILGSKRDKSSSTKPSHTLLGSSAPAWPCI